MDAGETQKWSIKVADRVYGPYTLDQMRAFAEEGRLAAQSLIALSGSTSWRHAIREEALQDLFLETRSPKASKPVLGDTEETGPANFVVIFDVVSGGAGRIEMAVHRMGPAFRLTDNVWALSTVSTAAGVRNALMPHLQPQESLFVVDATRGRSAWHNYGPEVVSKLHRYWMRPGPKSAEA